MKRFTLHICLCLPTDCLEPKTLVLNLGGVLFQLKAKKQSLKHGMKSTAR